ncbi:MAG: APC family permease, partial [Alphaproteobacteria bacterium]|nr:APC family permease [Alphaproteobacteria bacterium]
MGATGEAVPASDVEAFGYRQELKRALGLFDLLVYGLVFIVPMAPVAVFGIVFNASHGMVPLIYAVGLVAMLFTALSYTTMARAFPVAGSVYTYSARSLGPTVGFFAGWAILLDYLLMPTLNYVACAIAMHATFSQVPKAFWVVGLLAIATVINYLGITTTARMNRLMLVGGLIILAFFLACAGYGVAHGTAGAHLSLAPFYNSRALKPGLIFGALSLAVLSFLGFDAISTLSEESIGGAAAIGRATLLSLCIAALLFIAQTWLASLFVLGRNQFPAGDATNAAFYDITQTVGGYGLKFLLTVPGVVVGGMASALTAQAATARLIYGMARDGKLPRALAHIHASNQVPERAILLVAVVTLVLGVFLVDRLELLTSMVNFGALLGFLLL